MPLVRALAGGGCASLEDLEFPSLPLEERVAGLGGLVLFEVGLALHDHRAFVVGHRFLGGGAGRRFSLPGGRRRRRLIKPGGSGKE